MEQHNSQHIIVVIGKLWSFVQCQSFLGDPFFTSHSDDPHLCSSSNAGGRGWLIECGLYLISQPLVNEEVDDADDDEE